MRNRSLEAKPATELSKQAIYKTENITYITIYVKGLSTSNTYVASGIDVTVTMMLAVVGEIYYQNGYISAHMVYICYSHTH